MNTSGVACGGVERRRCGVGNWDELDETLDGGDGDEVVDAELFEDGDALDELDAADETDDLEDGDALEEGLDDPLDDVPDEVRAELEAVAAAEDEMHAALEDALSEAQRALEAQRDATRAAVGRYREALLAAEPDLPPDLVAGETLEEIDASVAAARQTVARIRERMSAAPGASASRGFPVGSPSRGAHSSRGLTSAEKIAAGLSDRRA